jgi:hypothetical protein
MATHYAIKWQLVVPILAQWGANFGTTLIPPKHYSLVRLWGFSILLPSYSIYIGFFFAETN